MTSAHGPRVVLVSTMYSPFQTELGAAIRARGLDYHILYTVLSSRGRGGHWTEDKDRVPPWVHVAPELRSQREYTRWVEERLDALRPEVIVANAIGRAPTWQALTTLRERGLRWHGARTPVGYWLEHPDFSRPWTTRLAVELLTRIQLGAMDYVLAIGDRAEAFYRRCHPTLPIHRVPYGADLSACFGIERPAARAPVTFLFSGQLVPRNNIAVMAQAFERLAQTHAGAFRLVISASGTEERHLRDAAARSPALAAATRYDRDFATWNDRLRPFRDSDVLVCPSRHAGWALVVPEAMAAGMPVIATDLVNAARLFVDPDGPEATGWRVGLDVDSLYRALANATTAPERVFRMGLAARRKAVLGTADHVAIAFGDAVLAERRRAFGH